MAKVVVDKLLGEPVLHDHTDKLSTSGGVMTGLITFPVEGFIMTDGTKYYQVTVNTSGTLVITELENIGKPMGLLLTLTYSS